MHTFRHSNGSNYIWTLASRTSPPTLSPSKHTQTQIHAQEPGVWIKTRPIALVWLVPWRRLPLIGYHNTGDGEEQLLSLDTRCRWPFNRNYIHHISRLADKLTPSWNRAKTEPRRGTRQVLSPTNTTHTATPMPADLAAGFQLQPLVYSLMIHGRGVPSPFYWLLVMCGDGTMCRHIYTRAQKHTFTHTLVS